MSHYNITLAKKIISPSHARFDCEQRYADHLHMSVPLLHPAPNTSALDFCLIEAFSCLQLTQKQREFIYDQLKLPF